VKRHLVLVVVSVAALLGSLSWAGSAHEDSTERLQNSASSGLTASAGQSTLNQARVSALCGGQSLTIGEAAAAAKKAGSNLDIRRTWILLGDSPVMAGVAIYGSIIFDAYDCHYAGIPPKSPSSSSAQTSKACLRWF